MALRASALKGAAIVAAICVALVVCWAGKPAEGASTCRIHRCISECSSNCEATAPSKCDGVDGIDAVKCWPNCIAGCTDGCQRAGKTGCDDACNSECKSNCNSGGGPNYRVCVASEIQACKYNCENTCKGEKVNN